MKVMADLHDVDHEHHEHLESLPWHKYIGFVVSTFGKETPGTSSMFAPVSSRP